MDEFAHVSLVAGGAEDVLLEGALLVQLEQHHLQIYTFRYLPSRRRVRGLKQLRNILR